jgi:hypothetical protein
MKDSIARRILEQIDPILAQRSDDQVPPIGARSKATDLGSSNVPLNSTELFRQEYTRSKVARVSYGKKVKRITLERFLVSMIVHRMNKVSFEDILVLYDNLLYLQDLAKKDPGFRDKFGRSLEVLAKVLKSLRFSSSNFSRNIENLSRELKQSLEGFYLPDRNIEGTKRHLIGMYHVLPYRESGIKNSQIPDKKYIGVGYRDKGNYTDPAYDGTPNWKEVIKGGIE